MDSLQTNSLHTLKEHFKTGNVVFDLVIVTLLGVVFTGIFNTTPTVIKCVNDWFKKRINRRLKKYKYCDTIHMNELQVRGADGYRNKMGVNGANSILITGIIRDLMLKGIINTVHENEIINVINDDTEESSRESNLKSVISSFPQSAVEWNGMRFDFEHKQAVNTDDKEPNVSHSAKIVVYSNDRTAMFEYFETCKRSEIDRVYPKRDCDENQLYYWFIAHAPTKNQNFIYSRREWSSCKTFDSMFFRGKTDIIQTLDHFRDGTGPWAPEKQRTRTCNIFLSGKPGSGKTSFIKGMANYTGRHIFGLNATKIQTDDELLSLVSSTLVEYYKRGHGGYTETETVPLNRRIYVFEDLDCADCEHIIAPRESVADAFRRTVTIDPEVILPAPSNDKQKKWTLSQLSLSGFLNMLNGLNELTGAMFVISTNQKHKFDPAIYRPGRMDIDLEMNEMAADDIISFISRYYKWDVPDDISRSIKTECDGKLMPCAIEQICQFNTDPLAAVNCMLSE